MARQATCHSERRAHSEGSCKPCYQRVWRDSRPPSDCHPDRRVFSRGRCRPCYTETLPNATCHPEKRAASRGLCSICYRKSRPNADCHPDRDRSTRNGLCLLCARSSESATCHPDEPNVSGGNCRRCYDLRIKYNITPPDFESLLTFQGYRCGLCYIDDPGLRTWSVDHDHNCCPGNKSCGKCVRSLLCSNCNTGLGLLQDNSELMRRAADYVDAHEAKRESKS